MPTLILIHSTDTHNYYMLGPSPCRPDCVTTHVEVHTHKAHSVHTGLGGVLDPSQGLDGDHAHVHTQPGPHWRSHTHLDWLCLRSRAPLVSCLWPLD